MISLFAEEKAVKLGDARDAPRGTFGKVPLGTPQNFLGQIQRVCLWKAVVKGFFSYRFEEKGFCNDSGMCSERGWPCGSRDISLHGSSAPIFVRVRDLRDPAAWNSHASSADRVFGIKNSRQRWEFQIGVYRWDCFQGGVVPKPPSEREGDRVAVEGALRHERLRRGK